MEGSPTPPRRRCFRFSLRTLLIVVAVVAVPVAWVAKERRQSRYETQIAKLLKEEKFNVGLSGPYDEIEAFDAGESQGWWRKLAWQLLGERIIYVSVANTEVQDAALLSELTNVQWIDLSFTSVSDISPLASVRYLECALLDSTPLSDLTPLEKLTNLKLLSLTDTQVRDVTPLSHLENLEALFLDGTQVADLAPLAGLKNLKNITLDNTAVTTEQIETLQKALPNCEIKHDSFP